jgi:hypothetical protein
VIPFLGYSNQVNTINLTNQRNNPEKIPKKQKVRIAEILSPVVNVN